jgi:hypothetical protein
MRRPIYRAFTALSAVLAIALLSVPAVAAPIPSRADDPEPTLRDTHVATIEDVLAREDVTEALESYGLGTVEIENRLAVLSDDDIRHLANHLDQIQAAGEEVPEYIWWLAGGLLAVLILVAIF